MKSLIFVVFLLPFTLLSQNEVSWKWQSFDAAVEYNVYSNSNLALNKFVKDPSQIVSNTPYFLPSNYLFGLNFNSWNFSGSATLSTKKAHQFFSFGASYSSYTNQATSSFINGTRTVVDSFELVSQNSSTTILIDSVWSDNEFLTFRQHAVSIHAEYLIKTKRTRVSGSIGGGFRVGMTLTPEMRYSRYQSYRYRYTDTNGYEVLAPQFQVNSGIPPYRETIIDSKRSSIESKSSLILTPYIPIQFEYTPFLHRNILSKISIQLRGKAGSEFQFISGAKTSIRPFFSVGLGLKYYV